MNSDLKIIKKKYGENFSKLCRKLFPNLLEQPNLLSNLIINNFYPNHELYNDLMVGGLIVEFSNYINSLVVKKDDKVVYTNKTAKELLLEAGYNLYHCQTTEEVNNFKKYYEKSELLCTFNHNRLSKCHVFFAVKKDVDKIKRSDFKKPNREDLYGTSVISIQFTKDKSHTLSIKNRYNHTVDNPDATFLNNLDNIIPGLTKAFERDYGLVQKFPNDDFLIDGYIKASDGRYYKYNYEIGNIYYCPNNIIIDNFKVKKYDKEKYILMDYFILDLVNKKISIYDSRIKDSFIDGINNIEKIKVINDKTNKVITISNNQKEDIVIILNNQNKIVSYKNNNIYLIDDYFLRNNSVLVNIELNNVLEIKNFFLHRNRNLEEINLPNLKILGSHFINQNDKISKVYLPNLKKVTNSFLSFSKVKSLTLPNLKYIGSYFLCSNLVITDLNLPKLKKVKDGFLYNNNSIKQLNFSLLEEIGNDFLSVNNSLVYFRSDNLKMVGHTFLRRNGVLNELYLPSLTKVGDFFLALNFDLEKLILPKLEKVGDCFLYKNHYLKEVYLPNLKFKGLQFLKDNPKVKNLIIKRK